MATGFEATGVAIVDPLYMLWLSFKNIFPGLIAAIIVIIIGWFVALIIGHAIRIILEKIGLDAQVKKANLTKVIGHIHLPNLFGEIIKWYIFIIFLQVAVSLLHLGTLSSILDTLVRWLPNVIAAVLIFIFGWFIAYYVEHKIMQHSKVKAGMLGAHILKMVIMILVIVMALKQIGIEVSLVENIVLLIIGALAIGFAIALGIGFGLGMRKNAEKWINDYKRKYF